MPYAITRATLTERELSDGSKAYSITFGSVEMHCASLNIAFELEKQLNNLIDTGHIVAVDSE